MAMQPINQMSCDTDKQRLFGEWNVRADLSRFLIPITFTPKISAQQLRRVQPTKVDPCLIKKTIWLGCKRGHMDNVARKILMYTFACDFT